jgi:hypothetical protein
VGLAGARCRIHVSGYQNGHFAESTATCAATLLRVLRDLLPTIRVPVHVFYAAADPLALVANGE